MVFDDFPRTLRSIAGACSESVVSEAVLHSTSERDAPIVQFWLAAVDSPHELRLAGNRGDAHCVPTGPASTGHWTVRDVDACERLGLASALLASLQIQSIATFALVHEEVALGLLLLAARDPLVPDDLERLGAIADHAAIAISNVRAAAELSLLRDLFEEAPLPYVLERMDSGFIRANRAAVELLGVAPDEVERTLGRHLLADAPQTQRRLQEAFGAVQGGREKRDVVLELRRKDDGRPIWVQWASRPATDRGFTRTMMVDVTDRELMGQTKAALEFSLEAGQVGDWDLDLLTDTSHRSLRHDQCFGYESPIPDDQWGVSEFLRHVFPADRARVEGSIRGAVLALEDWQSEFRVVWPDGSLHWLAARGRVYRVEAGRATRMLGIVMDITDRKRDQEALEASERVARGQVEALTGTLDKMAAESSPDRLVEHVLHTLAQQMGATSCSIWRRDPVTGLFDYQAALEGEDFRTRSDPAYRGISLRVAMDEYWPNVEDLDAGRPAVVPDIQALRDSSWRDHLVSLGVVTVLIVPMLCGGRIDGAIGVRFGHRREFGSAEIDLAKALANQAMLALQLTRVSLQARESAVVAERNRMARDIHDTLAQGFTGVIVQLEAASDARSQGLDAEAESHVERARGLARESLHEARRSVRALRPSELDQKALCEALEALIRKMTAGTAIRAEFTLQGTPSVLPRSWDENLLRIVQEVLTNVLRHARASSFTALVQFEPDQLLVRLSDDGQGFDPALKHDGLGLLGVQERVAAMDGVIALNTRSGAGVTISVAVPLRIAPGRNAP